MKILLVEDDKKVGSFLKENLVRDCHSVSHISSIDEVDNFLSERPFQPDIIILDRLLGNHDTKFHLSKFKTRLPDSKIIYLSALNTPQEKANLLDEGADDYLGKPFSLVELQARLRALSRRSSESSAKSLYISVSDIVIDLKQRSARCADKKIDLTNKEYALLMNFAQNENKVFSKYQLMDIIWEANLEIESNVLEVTIMNLRKKLNESHSTLKILSKRNIGYWLET